MQPRLTVGILVLQAEGLVCAIRYLGFFFQTAPAGVVAEPNQITFIIGHLTRDADLLAVEVVGLLAAFIVCGCPIADFRQGVVAYSSLPLKVTEARLCTAIGRGDLAEIV